MKDGEIKLDSKRGKAFGFTSDKFYGWLWKTGDSIYISFIESVNKGKGNLSRLFTTIWDKGYSVKVPTPFSTMKKILIKKEFTKTEEWSDKFNSMCEVWVK